MKKYYYAVFDTRTMLVWDRPVTFTAVNKAFKFFSNLEGHGILYTGNGTKIRESGNTLEDE